MHLVQVPKSSPVRQALILQQLRLTVCHVLLTSSVQLTPSSLICYLSVVLLDLLVLLALKIRVRSVARIKYVLIVYH